MSLLISAQSSTVADLTLKVMFSYNTIRVSYQDKPIITREKKNKSLTNIKIFLDLIDDVQNLNDVNIKIFLYLIDDVQNLNDVNWVKWVIFDTEVLSYIYLLKP